MIVRAKGAGKTTVYLIVIHDSCVCVCVCVCAVHMYKCKCACLHMFTGVKITKRCVCLYCSAMYSPETESIFEPEAPSFIESG